MIKMLQRSENAACRGPSWRRVASSAKQLLGQDLKTLPRDTWVELSNEDWNVEIRLSTFADSNFVLGNATAPPDYPIGELPSFMIVRNVCDYLQYTALMGSVTWWVFTGQRSCRCVLVQAKTPTKTLCSVRRIQLLAPSFGVQPQMLHISMFTSSHPPFRFKSIF